MIMRPVGAAIAASLAFLVSAASLSSAEGAPKPPRFERLALTPITVEPQPLEGALERSDEAETVRKLSEEATKQAERILARAHLAGSVERLASENAGRPFLVRGTLRLPVSLPPHVIGWDAGSRKGRFSSVTLTLADAQTGAVIGRGEATCDWKDAPWIYGGSHNRRNAPLGRVLEHFARKTTERAVWDLAKQLSLSTAKGQKELTK